MLIPRHMLLLFALLSLGLAPAAAQQRQLLECPSIHSPAVGTRGMVVSQNEIASRVGADILKQGGNAVDAAVAVGFALAVTLPRAGNVGGDGFMTIYDAKSKRVRVIDFRSVAPKAATLERFVSPQGKELDEASRGYLAPSVPGTVAGLYMAHRNHGRLKWAAVIQPAIDLAAKGVVLSPDEAFVFSWGRERLSTSAAAKATFYKKDGSLYAAGETLKQPALAWTLKQVQRGGADAFYKGAIAKRFAADMARHGGLITLEDLADYRAVEREPLVGTYRGYTVYSTPPASAGGATLINMLNILEHFELKPLGPGSAAALHIMAETMKLGYADRYGALGDTDFVQAPVRGFISKAYAAERAKLISSNKARPVKEMGPGDPFRHESK